MVKYCYRDIVLRRLIMDRNEKREIKRVKYQNKAAKAQAKADKLYAKRRKTNNLENLAMGMAVIGIVALAITAAIVGSVPDENK